MKLTKKQFIESILSNTIVLASGDGDNAWSWVDRLVFDEKTEVLTIHCRPRGCYFVNVECTDYMGIVQAVADVVSKHN